MEPKRPSKLKRLFLLSVLGFIAWFGWALVGLHVKEPRGPISAAKAESIVGIRVPPEAKNIRAASFSQWIEYGQYLRFEAPPDVCLRYAATVVPGATTQTADPFLLAAHARPTRPEVFKDFSWFDLAQAEDVVTAGGGPSQPAVWVDRGRGVFYYRKTD